MRCINCGTALNETDETTFKTKQYYHCKNCDNLVPTGIKIIPVRIKSIEIEEVPKE